MQAAARQAADELPQVWMQEQDHGVSEQRPVAPGRAEGHQKASRGRNMPGSGSGDGALQARMSALGVGCSETAAAAAGRLLWGSCDDGGMLAWTMFDS